MRGHSSSHSISFLSSSSYRCSSLLGARTLLMAPGIATRNKCLTTRNKKLLGTKGIATRSKDATFGAPGLATNVTRSVLIVAHRKGWSFVGDSVVGALRGSDGTVDLVQFLHWPGHPAVAGRKSCGLTSSSVLAEKMRMSLWGLRFTLPCSRYATYSFHESLLLSPEMRTARLLNTNFLTCSAVFFVSPSLR